MKLLTERELIWSPVVANTRMNRERNASGINSYEQEFKFKPEKFLEERIKSDGKASWLDLCCGYGKALSQVAEYFQSRQQLDKIRLEGVDLIDGFISHRDLKAIEFHSTSVTRFTFQKKYDLITCIHGLHYVGDKFKVIQNAVNALSDSGLFVANLDLKNVVVNDTVGNPLLNKTLLGNGFSYSKSSKLLKKNGALIIDFGLKYLGADDNSGPNYTGQEAVTSYYTLH